MFYDNTYEYLCKGSRIDGWWDNVVAFFSFCKMCSLFCCCSKNVLCLFVCVAVFFYMECFFCFFQSYFLFVLIVTTRRPSSSFFKYIYTNKVWGFFMYSISFSCFFLYFIYIIYYYLVFSLPPSTLPLYWTWCFC